MPLIHIDLSYTMIASIACETGPQYQHSIGTSLHPLGSQRPFSCSLMGALIFPKIFPLDLSSHGHYFNLNSALTPLSTPPPPPAGNSQHPPPTLALGGAMARCSHNLPSQSIHLYGNGYLSCEPCTQQSDILRNNSHQSTLRACAAQYIELNKTSLATS